MRVEVPNIRELLYDSFDWECFINVISLNLHTALRRDVFISIVYQCIDRFLLKEGHTHSKWQSHQSDQGSTQSSLA